MNVDNSLVNAHFESVPSLGTFTAGTLTSSDSENLSGNADWTSGFVALILSSGNDLSTCLFQWCDLLASQGHSRFKVKTE